MAPSTTTRRLLKEVSELSPSTANPNPAFHAAPVSDSDLHEWHFTLLGPPSPSPYAGGMYHGRISLPPQYPLKPPNFRFLTPSGRFEVNREICLSISGFHEETWMPAWGVRTALTALRSFMAEKGTAGQVGGLEASGEVRRRLAAESRRWRCGECARSNEEVMQEWWVHCKDAGVKVDEEGCGLDLEALPEGMNVTAFNKTQNKGKERETITPGTVAPSTTEAELPPLIPGARSSKPTVSSLDDMKKASEEVSGSVSPSTASSMQKPLLPTTAESTSTGDFVESSLTTSTTMTRPSASQQQRQPVDRPGLQQAAVATESNQISLDRMITAVFLALCLMVVKRIFFPAKSGSGIGPGDDWEIGLSREY